LNKVPTPDTSTPRGRVLWVLDHEYHGNQSEMARATGISQASWSRVIRGAQEPGRRLMAAIAALPSISETWIYTGQGEPRVRTRVASLAEGSGRMSWTLPVSEEILPGKPGDHSQRLTGYYFPVAPEYFGPARYWLKFTASISVPAGQVLKLHPGNLILLEADPRAWLTDPEALDGKPCALRLYLRGGEVSLLARCGTEFEWGGTSFIFSKDLLRAKQEHSKYVMPTPQLRPLVPIQGPVPRTEVLKRTVDISDVIGMYLMHVGMAV
jgi:hypothetical protein